jgi:NitT/TauT family transport system substrate-binding protein
LTTLGDNKNFFGLNPQYQEITGEQLYYKMSIVYSDLSLAKSSIAWRSVSNTSIVESINLTLGQEAEGGATFTPVTAEVKQKAAISNKQVTINFLTNSSTLSDDAQATIDKEFVNIAKTFATARIRIEGNTDAVGDAGYNKALSFKRALAVANYLTKEYRFDSNRFIVIGNGMSKAVIEGVSGSSEAYRRTDFKLVEE